MANSKISALTSATTPLAGTETLPIVQSSTTKQVSVANLTAGRQVDMSLLSVSSSAALLGNFNSTNATGGYLRWQTSGTTIWDIGTAKQVFGTGTGTDGGFGTRAGYYLGLGANGAESLRLTTTGDVSVLTGNLVIGTSGKGIDFSATSGSGTSELLADYEEGTWTVVWTNLTGTPASTTGYYTKIGRMVYFTYSPGSGTITATAASTRFSLPFTPAIEASGTQISQNVNFSFTTLILPSNANCYVGTFTSNFMVFSGSYHV